MPHEGWTLIDGGDDTESTNSTWYYNSKKSKINNGLQWKSHGNTFQAELLSKTEVK